MYNNGDILLRGELIDPSSGHLYQMLRRAGQLIGGFRRSPNIGDFEEHLILKPLLQASAKS